LPFPTTVLGDALQDGDFADQRTAALLYAGDFLFASTAFRLLWLWASRSRRLIRDEMCDEAISLRTWRMVIAIPAFSISFVVAMVPDHRGRHRRRNHDLVPPLRRLARATDRHTQ
jgi:hypothetical protein